MRLILAIVALAFAFPGGAAAQDETPAALRAQLEKEGGLSRLVTGLRREKAVDLALSRATMTRETPA